MESLLASLTRAQARLAAAGIDSAVIGALAVAVWGEPRLTRDVDLKVQIGRDNPEALVEAMGGDYDAGEVDACDILRRFGMLFVRDTAGVRIDLLLADCSFDDEAIRRARVVEVAPGVTARVCTAEDLVIYKLISTRAKDDEDARTVVRRQGDALDRAYVTGWLRQFEEALDDSTLVDRFRSMAG